MKLKMLIAGTMCTFMAASLTGCGSKEANNQGGGVSTAAESTTEAKTTEAKSDEPKSNDTVSIKYWVAMNPNVVSVAQNYGDILYYQELEKKTGVHIEFLHPPTGQSTEQFKLMIASRNDLPDVIETTWLSAYPGGPDKAVKDGVIIPLNDYIDKTPNFKKAMESNGDALKQSKTDEGTIFAFQNYTVADTRAFGGLMLRADWLEELGLEPPETIDEWETALTAFKDKKGAEAPLCINSLTLINTDLFNSAYNVGVDFYLDDNGKVLYGPIQPEYKEYLTTLNRWYKNGLIHPDFASIDSKIIDSSILNGNAGSAFGYIGGKMGQWYKAATEEGFELVGVPNPVMNKGDESKFLSEYANKVKGQCAAITTGAKNVDKILEMFDYIYTDEGTMLKNFGVEGVTYNMVDGKPVYTDLIMNNPDGLSIAYSMGKYLQCNYGAVGYGELPDYQDQYFQLDAQKQAVKALNKFADNASKYIMPPVTATSDESKDLATIMTEVKTFKDEEFVAFVTGAKSLDEFDNYVDEIKKMNIDKAIEIKTSGLERYNNR